MLYMLIPASRLYVFYVCHFFLSESFCLTAFPSSRNLQRWPYALLSITCFSMTSQKCDSDVNTSTFIEPWFPR